MVNKLVLAVTLSKNNDIVRKVVTDWIELTKKGEMKQLVTDMAVKMYSDAYVKRYTPPFFAVVDDASKAEGQ